MDDAEPTTLVDAELLAAAEALLACEGADAFEQRIDDLTCALLAWYGESRYREYLQEHLVRAPAVAGQQPGEGEIYFQSDKYPWCPAEFVPLKVTDPDAQKVLEIYAALHEERDAFFSADLEEAINIERVRRRCEGCREPATRSDDEGTPLCEACWSELRPDVTAP